MSIRPRLGAGVPELTARVARASNPAGTTAMWVRDRLDGLWEDEDFAGWYPRDGRPGLSPAQLATVSVLQFLLDLSDRGADLAGGGCTSLVHMERAGREHQVTLTRFTKGQCQPCPARAACTTSGDGKRTVGFPPRELYELQVRNRAGQQDPAWHKRYAVRSGIEGTACEFAHGHGMRHCRYRGEPKAHLQHVLTAIAVNAERLSQLPPGESTAPRPPTAFQNYPGQHDIQRLRSWRAVS